MSIFKVYSVLFLYLSFNFFLLGLYLLILDTIFLFEYNILNLNSVSVVMTIYLDWMSLSFMSFVFFISSMVVKYSEGYMLDDKTHSRFIFLVVLFVLSMAFLVISSNLISILLGWDGLGLTSFVLVIYYQNVKSFNAGMLTALTNRIGDAALLMGIAWMLSLGSWNFGPYLNFTKGDMALVFVSFFVILAAFSKSAQIPFSAWLPAAMAAPTPVSSLVHSSTLVTAGVYLLIRFHFTFSSTMMNILLFISLITMFMAGLGASVEFDLKKIIALSTLSQLGLMISILALGNADLAFFHLLIHALFKALLFMCAGMMIHNLGSYQDIRMMGVLVKPMPLSCLLFNICNLSLCGLPFLSGFYSKDLVAEALSMKVLSLFIYSVFFLSVGLTAFYSFRLTYYTLTGSFNQSTLHFLNEEDKPMLKSMMWLALLVIFMGSTLFWVLFPSPYFICLPPMMKLMTLLLVFMGIWLGYVGSIFNFKYDLRSLKFFKSSTFLASMWNLPTLSTFSATSHIIRLGKIYLKYVDQGWSEYYGGQKLYQILKKFSKRFQLFSQNHFKIFLLLLVVWVLMLIVLIFYFY
uniref:NADH-ubiquinone oxidoreductase chain 5 n=1 Tax=Otiorhynchus rugosostriatus TaxID=703598 RepID=J9PJ39_9CUCU|nr:NADH dehydrogenase subunit 5 [Otiorhynchus rugosostriatus]